MVSQDAHRRSAQNTRTTHPLLQGNLCRKQSQLLRPSQVLVVVDEVISHDDDGDREDEENGEAGEVHSEEFEFENKKPCFICVWLIGEERREAATAAWERKYMQVFADLVQEFPSFLILFSLSLFFS